MSTLFQCVAAADAMTVGGSEAYAKSNQFPDQPLVILSQRGDERYVFQDQEVVLEEGYCIARDSDGDLVDFHFQMHRPMTLEDL
jgi:hypothetical protein